MKFRPESVQKGNPNELTIKQHVLPAESIRRFGDDRGRVMVARLDTGRIIWAARPSDSCFVVERLWDQRNEVGFPANIERRFQFLVNRLLKGDQRWWTHEWGVLPEFHALWTLRAHAVAMPSADLQMKGVRPGSGTTKDMREKGEANFYIVPNDEGVLAGRFFAGIKIQVQLPKLAASVTHVGWRLMNVERGGGELLVPDNSFALYLPVTPTIAIVGGSGPEHLDRSVVTQLNRSAITMSHRQVFARNFASCPL